MPPFPARSNFEVFLENGFEYDIAHELALHAQA